MSEPATSELKRTPLYEKHVALGARMVPFAGWEMPVQYQGVIAEHRAVRSSAGLFDVSHMGEIDFRGPKAMEACLRVFTNDASKLKTGQAQYTLLLNEKGGIIDDVIVYRLADDHFFAVVNAGNQVADYDWIREKVKDLLVPEFSSDSWAQLALQGPLAAKVLARHTKEDLTKIPYMHAKFAEVGGHRVLLSRSGYTGEDGFEIYCESRFGPEIWDLLLTNREVSPIGLGARDTLRLEMKYPLHGNDITPNDTPLEAALGWAVKFTHPFIGREALEAQKAAGVSRKLVGFVLKSSSIPRSHYKVRTYLGESGEVRSGTKTPTTEKSIGLCYLPASQAQVGAAFEVEIRGQWNPAEVVETPFVKPGTVASS